MVGRHLEYFAQQDQLQAVLLPIEYNVILI